MDLTGSVALVSGASGGLGRVICERLADAGVVVAAGYRKGQDRAEALCSRIEGRGQRAIPVRLDHGDPASAEACVAEVVRRFGSLDILVNAAGMASGGHSLPAGDLDALTPRIWGQMVEVNFNGPFYLTRAAAAHLRASRLGRVVNIGSTIGHGPWGAGAAYAPSKGAVTALTRFLAASLAPDVTVNGISPGLMEGTEMSGGAPESYISGWRERSLLGVTTSLDDVATQVLAFCQSGTVTGQTVVIDGGIHFD